MKKFWVYWLLILCGFMWIGIGRVEAVPNIEFVAGTAFDFGEVRSNTSLNHEFIFKNTGDEVLRIVNVKGGWGCTASLVSANEIPAGGEGRITVTVKAGSYRGPVRQAVQVTTNVPGQENVVLTITAAVVVDLEAIPSVIQFQEKQKVSQIVLKSYIDTPIEIAKLFSPSGMITLSVSALTIPVQGEVTLTAELPPDPPDGIISEFVEVHSSLQSQPVLQIRLWANIQK